MRATAFLAIIIVVGGCSTTDDTRPVGTGYKTDQYKRSPCACIEMPQPPATDRYLRRLRQRLRS